MPPPSNNPTLPPHRLIKLFAARCRQVDIIQVGVTGRSSLTTAAKPLYMHHNVKTTPEVYNILLCCQKSTEPGPNHCTKIREVWMCVFETCWQTHRLTDRQRNRQKDMLIAILRAPTQKLVSTMCDNTTKTTGYESSRPNVSGQFNSSIVN